MSSTLNVNNFVTLKLNQQNYPLWREQILGLAESQNLINHLINEELFPPKFIVSTTQNLENPTPKLNDDFIKWKTTNILLRGWIVGTLSKESLGRVLGLQTSQVV